MEAYVDRNSPVPLYRQLQNIIRESIENGGLAPGTQIPPEHVLQDRYSLSRTTIREAIDELVQQGYLFKRHGTGTFVTNRMVQQTLTHLSSFTEELVARGLKAGSQILSFETVQADTTIAEILEIEEGEPVLRIVRLRSADDEPIGLQTAYLPARDDRTISQAELESYGSLYSLLAAKFGNIVVQGKETIGAAIASSEEAELLGLSEGEPLLVVRRLVYDAEGRVSEFSSVIYRADRFEYVIMLNR